MNEGVTEIAIVGDTSEELQGTQAGCGTTSHCSLLRLYVMFIFMWQSTFRLSDAGTDVLFAFIASFLLIVSVKVGCEKLREFCQTLPRNTAAARKVTGQDKEPFERWVCCPKCHSIYTLQQSKVTEANGQTVSMQCGYVQFPEHPQMRFRQPCGTVLLKSVRSPYGSTSLQPRLLYCYNSLIKAIGEMLKRPHFLEKCEQWRSLFSANPSMVYRDVYDGRIWRDFQEIDGHPFLALPYNFCLTLNVDWFQPFKRSTHSTGVLYLAIQNLPRKERFLSENVIVVGVIPGPKEPQKHINTFLGPLVDELLQLWEGVIMKVSNESFVLVRAALTCVACDIPAARKVCGFLGHNAARGCSVCLKKFPTKAFGEQADFSGYSRSEWTPRDLEVHRKKGIDHTECKTRSAQIDIEREYGVRYSLFQELPYFNPIRMTVVDPMHNLLLGTAKRMMAIWTEQKLITKQQLFLIQSNVDSFVTPNDVGRIPHKIASGFSGFTAEQWKNWTIIFSLSSLKGILPREHFQCWHIFVKACHLLCRRSITKQQVEEADDLLLSFCTSFEELYGKKSCTMNLHLHGHLASCIHDYGPVYSFWLFAFERLNGVCYGSFSYKCAQYLGTVDETFSGYTHEWYFALASRISAAVSTSY